MKWWQAIIGVVLYSITLVGAAIGAHSYFLPKSEYQKDSQIEKSIIVALERKAAIEDDIATVERRMLAYNIEWNSNSTWLNNIENNFPNDLGMSRDLKQQKRKVMERQEEIKRKLGRYEDELKELKKELRKLETGGG
jgi:chromosome segregation ATPase